MILVDYWLLDGNVRWLQSVFRVIRSINQRLDMVVSVFY